VRLVFEAFFAGLELSWLVAGFDEELEVAGVDDCGGCALNVTEHTSANEMTAKENDL
jgi:hypothetical protein